MNHVKTFQPSLEIYVVNHKLRSSQICSISRVLDFTFDPKAPLNVFHNGAKKQISPEF